MRTLIAFLLVSAATLMAQKPEFQEGLGQGYDGEWTHASRQLIALAEVIPPEKYSWRPAPGVRSISWRLTSVVGVAESVGATSPSPETVTFSLAEATFS